MGKEEIIRDSEDYAQKHGYILNPNKNVVEFIVKGIAQNERNFGQRYCSCRVFAGKNKEDSICPCVWHKKDIETKGKCHCGLFFKKD